ncbi:hypothetical protein GCM10010172_37470 [Paractinoplanes ferrugineus]|uniref:Uncharacterized protein n=1 Tax=Paractinoplanes ferrugineus TaxID=113564 RepID=A0A919IW89_9ACTN|nr:hypothetical protein [Actinoplanes ferrugineus]GIE09344.1 hypothetical protein Afe05nite_11840 [Actinoplanes ferrugineus]
MTMYETSDLHKRVARYEAAVDELRAAHQDIRSVLVDQVLFERWQQIGADLGFTVAASATASAAHQQDLNAMNQQIPQMAEAWAG